MKYVVMKPATPVDVRKRAFVTYEEMYAAWNVIAECDTEAEAAQTMRWHFPDAVGFPAPVYVSSVTGGMPTIVMAMIERITAVSLDGMIPFVMIVHAVSSNDRDRYAIKKRLQFSKEKWKPPVIVPASGIRPTAELRATNLDQPERPHVLVGRDRGHLVFHIELNGIAMSLKFDDPRLDLSLSFAHETSEPPVTVDRHDGPGDASADQV